MTLYKVERLDGETYAVWSVGYPTKRSAALAARRLNQTSAKDRFRVAPMTSKDYTLMAELEATDK